MKKYWHLFSFWLFSAFIVSWFLVMFPLTGFILLIVGIGSLCGYLFLALMIMLLIEALINRVPRWMAIIPIIFFGGYYALYFNQSLQIFNREAELQKANSTKTYNFNATQQHIVTTQGQHLASNYNIPVAYEKNQNISGGYLSYRIMTREFCNMIPKTSLSLIYKGHISYRDEPSSAQSFGALRYRKGLCLLRMPQKPTKKHLTFDIKPYFDKETKIREKVYILSDNIQILGEYREASVHKYKIFPIPFFGGVFGFFKFERTPYQLKTNPTKILQNTKFDPISSMLGIEKYTVEHYSSFINFSESEQAIQYAKNIAKSRTK